MGDSGTLPVPTRDRAFYLYVGCCQAVQEPIFRRHLRPRRAAANVAQPSGTPGAVRLGFRVYHGAAVTSRRKITPEVESTVGVRPFDSPVQQSRTATTVPFCCE